MSTIIPPVPLANPENQFRSDYIKSIAPITDFEYSQVRTFFLKHFTWEVDPFSRNGSFLTEKQHDCLKSSPTDASFVLVKNSKDSGIVRNASMDAWVADHQGGSWSFRNVGAAFPGMFSKHCHIWRKHKLHEQIEKLVARNCLCGNNRRRKRKTEFSFLLDSVSIWAQDKRVHVVSNGPAFCVSCQARYSVVYSCLTDSCHPSFLYQHCPCWRRRPTSMSCFLLDL